ncbi:MAG: ATP-binding protein [Thermoanaerobaculia bacterium]
MAIDGKTTELEREKTDQSLRTERAKADQALAQRRTAIERDADAVIQRARENADAVLTAARDKADERLEEAPPRAAAVSAVTEGRVIEDESLRDERASADGRLRRERAESVRALSMMAVFERDKTDRSLLTERIRSDEAVSHRDDFLGIVSHDLRNLLNGIVISAEQLSRTETGNDREQTLAQTTRIQRYAARMDRLIGDLMDVATLDAGKLAIAPVSGDWEALIAEALDAFHASATAKGLSLRTEIGEGPLITEFDHDRMLQVLANLVANAMKFTSPGGIIRVGAERSEDGIRVWVSDTGSGIPAGMLEAVFERFWQVGKNDRRGMGLGLYISRSIVEAHGGAIRAESREGEGSTFSFTVPRKLPAA